MPNTVEQSTILQVYSYDSGTKTSKKKRTLEFTVTEDMETIKLASIRGVLAKNGVFESPEYGLSLLGKDAICPTDNGLQRKSSFL